MLEDSVEAALGRLGATRAGIVVAASGGPDSTALLHALHALAGPLRLRLVVAHLDHGLRGRASRADAAFVRRLAGRLGLPFHLEAADVAAYARAEGLGIEDAARRLRYDFLHRVRRRARCRFIATGHTLDDQAETVLLRLFRGAGPAGLQGVHALRADGVLRPLLGVRRAEALAYLKERRLRFRVDATNADLSRDRARLRARLLPAVERDFGPGAAEALARLAEIMAAEAAWTEALVEEALRGVERAKDLWRIPRTLLREAPEALAQRVLERARRALGAPEWSAARRADLLALARGARTAGALDLPGLRAWVEGDALALARRVATEGPWSYTMDAPGTLDLPEAGLRLTARWAKAPGRPAGGPGAHYLGGAAFPLTVRSPAPGDRMRPLGMNGRKKLQDLFVDAKTPRRLRNRTPVVEIHGEVACVAGHRTSEAFRASPGRRALRLEFREAPETAV